MLSILLLAVIGSASDVPSSGEGIIGLAWGLMIAGCRTVVASQYRVESQSTAELMLEFHRGLRRSGLAPADALQRSQKQLIHSRDHWHPYYWAAFVVITGGH
jgi:CHAT domain-containing protein